MIKAIVFDLGGVLIDWNPDYLYTKIIQDIEKREYFLQNICTSDWNECQDAGRPIEEGANLLIEQYPEFKAEISAFYGRWDEMLGGPIEGTLNILELLYNNYELPLYALTNWSHETFPIALSRFGFLQMFRDIVVSGIEKMKKPDPALYNILLTKHKLDPKSTLFIDDNERNINAAKAIGFKTIHFKSPKELQWQLENEFNIKIALN